ncbi:MAG: hypothetical protein GC181_02620 [Bacteroidetes bacterium]|nr:hypothetical protein [Bacteroidota bacterium]
MRSILRFIKSLLPHRLVLFIDSRRRTKLMQSRLEESLLVDKNQFEREKESARNQNHDSKYSYEEAIHWLMGKGIPETQIRTGSIPEQNILRLVDSFGSEGKREVKLLHVGNFVGISLSSLVYGLKKNGLHVQVVTIDPDIPHRGVERPNKIAQHLMEHYQLNENVLWLHGYSLHKSLSNDGRNYSGDYNPEIHFENEFAPSHQLAALARMIPEQFDLILLDGNHNASYLNQEMGYCLQLLKQDGWLALDDVDENWPAIKSVYTNHDSSKWKEVYADGRMGILQKIF